MIAIAVFFLIVALYVYGMHIFFKPDWELVSSTASPDGAFTIKHYRSNTEAGHAPYGDNLIIESWRSFPTAKSGEKFFAGYCGNDFMYEWQSNEKTKIRCPKVTEQGPIRTQAIVVHGINVEVTR